MSQPTLRFPDGVTGLALFLLRISIALIVFPATLRIWPDFTQGWVASIAPSILAISLCMGLATRTTSILIVLLLAIGIGGADWQWIAGSAASAAVLALLGPGAYSIDAHIYGRRVIRLDPRSPDWGGRS